MLVTTNSYDAASTLALPADERVLFNDAVRNAAACQLAETLQVPMDYSPLYGLEAGRCQAIALRNMPEGATATLYSDAACQRPVHFYQTGYGEFCQRYVHDDQLGDASDLLTAEPRWTLTPAARMPLPVESLLGYRQPFMQRMVYRQQQATRVLLTETGQALHVRKGSGQCVMEMRVFKAQTDATGLVPLLVFPGGALQRKALHSLALQSRIARFTDAGFLVFLPFMRTIAGGEGPQACRDADWQALTDDAGAALQWVNQHAQQLGGLPGPPALMAQGSGGLLASWLSIQYPSQVRRTLLLYPLIDTHELLAMIRQGRYRHRSGINLLERLTGRAISELTLDDPALQATRLLPRIRQQAAGSLPPLHILHGTEDQRVPVQQSRLLCSAWLNRDVLSVCGETLFLLEGAGHQLDYCVPGVLCPAGNRQHRAMVRLVLKRARCWLKGELDEATIDAERMCLAATRPASGH